MNGDKSKPLSSKSKFGYVPVKVIEEYTSSITGAIVGYLVEVGTSEMKLIISYKDFIEMRGGEI